MIRDGRKDGDLPADSILNVGSRDSLAVLGTVLQKVAEVVSFFPSSIWLSKDTVKNRIYVLCVIPKVELVLQLGL